MALAYLTETFGKRMLVFTEFYTYALSFLLRFFWSRLITNFEPNYFQNTVLSLQYYSFTEFYWLFSIVCLYKHLFFSVRETRVEIHCRMTF